ESSTDPLSILPLELISMILQYRTDMKSIIALERVSKRWSAIRKAICTPTWVVGNWGLDVDWCRSNTAMEPEGRTDWQKFKAEGAYAFGNFNAQLTLTVKSCH